VKVFVRVLDATNVTMSKTRTNGTIREEENK